MALALVSGWTAGLQEAEAARLIGTVNLVRGEPGPSHAVFQTEDGRQMVLAQGQEIDDCRLAAVYREHVLMECAGGTVSLAIHSGLQPRRRSNDQTAAVYKLTLPRDTFEATAEAKPTTSQLTLEPAVRNGLFYGYRVARLQRGCRFHRLGLRSEDVIVSLNGVPASTPGPFMQALGALSGQSSFELTLERAGEQIAYSYLLD